MALLKAGRPWRPDRGQKQKSPRGPL